MNPTHPPVLVNGIPVRIIDKDLNHHIKQLGPGIWPRSLELFNLLNIQEVNDLYLQARDVGTSNGIFDGAAYGTYPYNTI
ncbi:hypothetical protein DFH29DRAFT_1000969 [Suillus ampliporus]|nr:hypothetical protein DFH29DRAFT_1000969 [Suillus ampliporus]